MNKSEDQPQEAAETETQAPASVEEQADRQNQLHRQQLAKARRIALAKSLAILTILVLLILFVIQNSQPVRIDYLVTEGNPRLIWVIVVCTVLGGVVGYLIAKPGKNILFHKATVSAAEERPTRKNWRRS